MEGEAVKFISNERASRTDGSIAEGRDKDLKTATQPFAGHVEVQSAGIKPGLPSVVLTLAPADKPDLRDLHTHRSASTVGISEEYVNSPHDGWRV